MYKDEVALLLAIGKVCRFWSYLEFLLADCIWSLSKLNKEEGIKITGNLEILVILERALLIAENEKAISLIAELTHIKSVIDDLRIRRNYIVHGIYLYSAQTDTMYLEHYRQRKNPELITPDIVNTLAKEIKDTADKFHAALVSHGFMPK